MSRSVNLANAQAATAEPAADHAASLGSPHFRRQYGLKYAYLAGAMYKGIASPALVIAMARARLMGYLGTGGLDLDTVAGCVRRIQSELTQGQSYGMNLLCDIAHPERETRLVDLFLEHRIRYIEAAAYMQLTPDLVRYRLTGAKRLANGKVDVPNRILAKVSRPEIAAAFMQPAPKEIISSLLESRKLTAEEAQLARTIPVAHEICVESDSGGHTDRGVALVLVPAILSLRDRVVRDNEYADPISVGAAGGLGTPAAVAAAFVMGADFVVTGSINQCTVESGVSDVVKEMLQSMEIQDTAYAPAGDMFELGAKVQVLKKGLFFPTRAAKLHELYMRYGSLEEIDAKTLLQIQEKYFQRSFEKVWSETRPHLERTSPALLKDIESNPKKRMAAIFKWYFMHSTRLALHGDSQDKLNYQVQCGQALGGFNQWVRGTELERWQNRRSADIGERLMIAAAGLLKERSAMFQR